VAVSGTECLAPGTRAEDQLADRVAMVHQRQRERIGDGAPLLCSNPKVLLVLLERDGSIGQLQRLFHGLNNGWQDGIRCKCRFETLA
jgi:hypothetical protein